MANCCGILWPLLLLQLSPLAASAQLSCRDADGSPVDWFVALKQPECMNYSYITSRSQQRWRRGSQLSSGGPVYKTLLQTFARVNRSDWLLLAYNDEKPATSQFWARKGHMKGVVMFNGSRGFWLLHSVPKFPDLDAGHLEYPSTGVKYGQSFICISAGADQLNSIGRQLWVSEPAMYRLNISSQLLRRYPYWRLLRNSNRVNMSYSVAELRTVAGAKFRHVAKSRLWRRDLYDSLLAPQLRASLLVETWEHGTELLQSNCSARFLVERVRNVSGSVFGPPFSSSRDHSKWCVSADSGTEFVCVGDMNRAKTQFRRGGGALCFSSSSAHRLFRDAVEGVDPCPFNPNQFELVLYVTLLLVAGCTSVLVACAALFCLQLRRGNSTYQRI